MPEMPAEDEIAAYRLLAEKITAAAGTKIDNIKFARMD